MDIALGSCVELSNLQNYPVLKPVANYVSSSKCSEEEYINALDAIAATDKMMFDTHVIERQTVAIHKIRNRDCRWRYSDVWSEICVLLDEYAVDNPFHDRDDTEEDVAQWLQGYLRIDLDLFSDEERAELINANLESHGAEVLELVRSLSDWRKSPAVDFPISDLTALGDYAGIEVDTETSDIEYLTHMIDRVFRALLAPDEFTISSLADKRNVECCASTKDRGLQAFESKSIRIAMTPQKAKALGIRCMDPHFVVTSVDIATEILSPAAKWIADHIPANCMINEGTNKNDAILAFGPTMAERDRYEGKSEEYIATSIGIYGDSYSEEPMHFYLEFPMFSNDMIAPEEVIEKAVKQCVEEGVKFLRCGKDVYEFEI